MTFYKDFPNEFLDGLMRSPLDWFLNCNDEDISQCFIETIKNLSSQINTIEIEFPKPENSNIISFLTNLLISKQSIEFKILVRLDHNIILQ